MAPIRVTLSRRGGVGGGGLGQPWWSNAALLICALCVNHVAQGLVAPPPMQWEHNVTLESPDATADSYVVQVIRVVSTTMRETVFVQTIRSANGFPIMVFASLGNRYWVHLFRVSREGFFNTISWTFFNPSNLTGSGYEVLSWDDTNRPGYMSNFTRRSVAVNSTSLTFDRPDLSKYGVVVSLYTFVITGPVPWSVSQPYNMTTITTPPMPDGTYSVSFRHEGYTTPDRWVDVRSSWVSLVNTLPPYFDDIAFPLTFTTRSYADRPQLGQSRSTITASGQPSRFFPRTNTFAFRDPQYHIFFTTRIDANSNSGLVRTVAFNTATHYIPGSFPFPLWPKGVNSIVPERSTSNGVNFTAIIPEITPADAAILPWISFVYRPYNVGAFLAIAHVRSDAVQRGNITSVTLDTQLSLQSVYEFRMRCQSDLNVTVETTYSDYSDVLLVATNYLDFNISLPNGDKGANVQYTIELIRYSLNKGLFETVLEQSGYTASDFPRTLLTTWHAGQFFVHVYGVQQPGFRHTVLMDYSQPDVLSPVPLFKWYITNSTTILSQVTVLSLYPNASFLIAEIPEINRTGVEVTEAWLREPTRGFVQNMLVIGVRAVFLNVPDGSYELYFSTGALFTPTRLVDIRSKIGKTGFCSLKSNLELRYSANMQTNLSIP
eukprot:scpid55784/ scgid4859/ 